MYFCIHIIYLQRRWVGWLGQCTETLVESILTMLKPWNCRILLSCTFFSATWIELFPVSFWTIAHSPVWKPFSECECMSYVHLINVQPDICSCNMHGQLTIPRNLCSCDMEGNVWRGLFKLSLSLRKAAIRMITPLIVDNYTYISSLM